MSENIQLIFIIFILLFIGIYFLIKNIKMYKNENKLKEYIENHPKGVFLKNKYGVEKAVQITKNYFLPFGIIISILFIYSGLYLIFIGFIS